MKAVIASLTLAFALAVFPAQAPALEIGATVNLENLRFAHDREETEDTFSGRDFYWGGSVFATHTFSEDLSFDTGFYQDTILRNVLYTTLHYSTQYLSLGVGPFFGFFNSTSTILKSGISTRVEFSLPGKVFILLSSDNSIGGRLVEEGDYIQEGSDISFGFYVRNAICSLNLRNKKFTQKQDSLETVDNLTEYSFDAEIFQKNLPYRITLSFAYQLLDKKYVAAATTRHTLNSIVLGTETRVALNRYLDLLVSLDSSIYTFGQNELAGVSNPGPGGYTFRAYTGCSIDLERLKPESPPGR
jgi:hypothetical protein